MQRVFLLSQNRILVTWHAMFIVVLLCCIYMTVYAHVCMYKFMSKAPIGHAMNCTWRLVAPLSIFVISCHQMVKWHLVPWSTALKDWLYVLVVTWTCFPITMTVNTDICTSEDPSTVWCRGWVMQVQVQQGHCLSSAMYTRSVCM